MHYVRLLLFTVFLFTVGSTTGQVRYGVVGGVQVANVASTVDLTSLSPMVGILSVPIKPRTGFRAGLFANIPLTDRLAIRPQLLYSVKGGNVDVGAFASTVLTKFGLPSSTVSFGDMQSKVVVNYVELPVLATYSFPVGAGQLLIGAGPYAAVAVGGSINGEAINFNTSGFHKLDVGVTASLGYELPMGLGLSAYYAHGLTNISKNSTPNFSALNPTNPTASIDPSAFGGTLRNRSYGLSVSYLLGKRPH